MGRVFKLPLNSLNIPPFLDTSSGNLITEFFTPLLANSMRYERGVGYFSSGWLRAAAAGMVAFAANGGKARWVTSPILDENDWRALQTGDQARTDAHLYTTLCHNLTTLAETLDLETLSALSWMVADGILDFRLCVPIAKLNGGDFHDKFGIFTDAEGNQVSFNGSYNDSIHGLRNYESIKSFCSWEPAFVPLVHADAARFERLWNNQDPNVQVFDLPAAAREDILRLRTSERPYPAPNRMQTVSKVSFAAVAPFAPFLPDALQLRDYQQAAIDAWFANKKVGILEMATGTGKPLRRWRFPFSFMRNRANSPLSLRFPISTL